ncbi:MAG: hypothetical protein LKM43_04300, partial [Wolbachia endosymbiont of Penenirmus auritus]|nr:hypothetical protein [Wolbachia endosymbiont of Penenirmus auritus]
VEFLSGLNRLCLFVAYISNIPRYQRALDLAYEKLNAAEKADALPDSQYSRLLYGNIVNPIVDLFRDEDTVSARNEFSRYLEGELLPAIMQIEGLPMTEYSVKSFKEKFDVNKLSAKSWRKFFDETRRKLESRAGDIQKKIRSLDEVQLGKLMQDPQIQATIKEEVTRKLDNQIEGLSDDELNALIKLSGSPEMSNEPPEVKKNLLRELALQLMFDVSIVPTLAKTGFAIAGPLGAFVFGGIGALISAFAGTVVERTIAGDPDPIPHSFTDTKQEAPLTLVGHTLGSVIARSGRAIKGLFKQGKEPVGNIVSRGFDAAIKDVPNIKASDVGEFLKSTAKQTSNTFQRKFIQDLGSKFSGESGSYTAKEFAEILAGHRTAAKKLAEKYGISPEEVRGVVSKIEERFLPLRADVSKTFGLLSGAKDALEKGNVRKVAEIFGELPEKIVIGDGVFTKGQVIRHFLLEHSNVIRNKYRKPTGSAEEVITFASQIGQFAKLPIHAIKEFLVKIGLNGITDPQIAKLFAKYSFGSSESEVIRQLQSALQGKIIEEQSGFIMEMLKKVAMSGSRVGLRGRVKWNKDD